MESRTVFERRDKVNYYLDLAEVVGERATCIRLMQITLKKCIPLNK
jgi:deoxycytidylate deaminase